MILTTRIKIKQGSFVQVKLYMCLRTVPVQYNGAMELKIQDILNVGT